jgi:predicted nuclease of restriction endonuclease-like (RecB) superfamily
MAKKKRSTALSRTKGDALASPNRLIRDIRDLIEAARQQTAQTVNSTLVMMYWHIGQRIRQDVLQNDRAEYGKEIVQTLSAQLTMEFGRGFGRRNLFQMLRFADALPDDRIVQTLSTQLSWSHFVELIPLDDPLKREFYAEMCRAERWSVRTLRHKIGHLLYERTAVAKKPADLIEQDLAALRDEDRMTPDLVFRDPYFLDFLGLTGQFDEKDIEQAILRELEAFILELGTDFAFVARQKRISVDSEDYYLDLLFFHRRLRRLVGIDLKLGKFQAADKGQMELYLRWLEEYEMQPGEEPPIGLPGDAKRLPHCTLAKGELTGHAHRIQEPNAAVLYERGDQRYLEVIAKRAALIHQEHAPISLARGVYRVWIQREYTPEAIRRVVD